ncbi:uncharacterized protein LOC118348047 [Juglans regia]|uniref:Uncharacterized protein LOC118348047 n=1 Tax=Juglans regia TaxID=51240 RepID=A0A6P9EB88_JUGRE|nr:uncharacterized protein LOC118348047 [Juglans regia]
MKLNVKKKTFLMEQVSALILSETPQKFIDPGSPNISIMIGESRIERALLDLESSVNLLPFSVYKQLGLGELKKTFIMLQLADRSVKEPRDSTFPVVIFSKLNQKDEAQFIEVLRKHRSAIVWTIADIKGIEAAVCTHIIHLEDDARPVHDAQRRLNPTMKEVFKDEVFKLLTVGIIYPISDTKKDAKPRLIRWILLLQEFNINIKDKKGVENVVADHLSRLSSSSSSNVSLPLDDSFPDEQLFVINKAPWYVDIVNNLVTERMPSEWSTQDKHRFLSEVQHFSLMIHTFSNIVRTN